MDKYSKDSNEKQALAAKGGDREARNSLYFVYERLLKSRSRRARHIAESYAGGVGPIEGEDVDQQGFIVFCELLDSWQPGELPFEEHLKRGAGWGALHYVRRSLGYRRKRKVMRFAVNDEGGVVEPESEAATGQMEQAEGRLLWRTHTEELDSRWKRLVEMKFREELTVSEIAVIDGHSRRTINRDLRSALDEMRTKLEDWWEDCG